MRKGYIKLFRKLLDNPWMQKPVVRVVWIELLLGAAYKPIQAKWKGEKILLRPGQLIITRAQLSINTGVQELNIYRTLKLLESEQQIEQQKSNRSTLITIVNWKDYQGGEQQFEQQMNNRCTTDEQQMNNRPLSNPIQQGDTRGGKEVKKLRSKEQTLLAELCSLLNELPQFERFTTIKGRYRVDQDKWDSNMKAWVTAYPNLDIKAELFKAAAWIQSNPKEAPRSNLFRFLNGWLAREDRKRQQAFKESQPSLIDVDMILIPGENK